MPKLGYIALPGVINLSYSRTNVLHECPRKFKLRERYATGERRANVHTEFGHAYAQMVQTYFETLNYERSVVAGMAAWDLPDLWERMPKSTKCFEEVLIAFDLFVEQIYPAYFEGKWTIAKLADHPAVELLYYINIYDRFSHQGHIDLVLQSVEDGSLCVLEVKTTERVVHPAMYSNSAQAKTYSVVCDELAKLYDLHNKYQVIYLVYNPKQDEQAGHTVFYFPLPATAKIEAITTILQECHQIQMYEESDFYPKNGSACFNWRPCELYGLCDLKVLGDAEQTAYEVLPLEAANLVIRIEEFAALQPEYGSDNSIQVIDTEHML